jgi:Cu-Zn family superoxide dismutase
MEATCEWHLHYEANDSMMTEIFVFSQVGDLGNVFADQDGVAYFSIIDSLISLTGPNSVLNRTLVVTEFGDDLGKGADQSKVNGNAGKPITCGVITLTA